ncbi:MAG: sigma-70 family RNA polymerase sigma factor [Reichenbachiella sp.]|uniref:RNA polymerase sigma factor n=1 Tax=Reichenbachiella sp. TaxID=2184521 RepID=UPI003265CFD1
MHEKSQILDELLVLRAQRGDREAFEQLVLKWHKKLLYQSHIRTRDWEQSQDIVQDVWQWLVGNLGKLRDAGKFGAWVRTVVDRRSIDWVRKQQRIRNQQTTLTNGSNQAIDTCTTDYSDFADDPDERHLTEIEQAMSQLNADSKIIIVLYYSESSSIETISEILKIPKGTVKSRLFHAREKLKKIIKQKNYERS